MRRHRRSAPSSAHIVRTLLACGLTLYVLSLPAPRLALSLQAQQMTLLLSAALFIVSLLPRVQLDTGKVLLGVALVMLNLRLFADSAVRSFQQTPAEAGLICLELACALWFALRARPGAEPERTYVARPSLRRLTTRGKAKALAEAEGAALLPDVSPHDRYVTCVHEAGHALFFALVPPYPYLRADAVRREHENGILNGSVLHVKTDWKEGEDMMLWEMMRLLAGREAERVVLGATYGGHLSDLAKHEALARNYLSREDVDEGLLLAAQTPTEAAHNAEVIRRLRGEQAELVRTFLTSNVRAVQAIADDLSRKGVLEGQQIYRHLKNVAVTEGIPVFDGAVTRG